MSFNARAWRTAIYDTVEEDVEHGLERVGSEVQRLAKSRAPVRKARNSGKKNLHTTTLSFTTPGGTRVSTPRLLSRLSEIATSGASKTLFKSPTPPSRLSPHQKDLFNERAAKNYTSLLSSPRQAFRLTGVVPTIAPSRLKGGRIRASTQRDLREGTGIHFNVATQHFEYGGFLRASIHREEFVEIDGKHMSIRIVADAPYARFVEFPTRRTKAQPFLYPAHEQAFQRVGQYMGLPER